MLSKQIKRKISIIFTIILIIGALNTTIAFSSPALDGDGDLFISSNADPAMDFSDDPLVARSRTVTLNGEMLADFGDASQAKEFAAFSLDLNLFDDTAFSMQVDGMTVDVNGTLSMTGKLDGIELSDATISVSEGIMWASIVYPGGLYRVRYAGNDDLHLIQELDQSKFPPDHPEEFDEATANLPPVSEAPETVNQDELADTGAVIDLLVLSTQSARTAVGGNAAMTALIATAIAETNTGYTNSSVNTSVSLAIEGRVTYTESGSFLTDVNRLQATADGYIDYIHGWRDTYDADAVILLINDSSACGRAYDIMTTVSTAFAPSAFAVAHYSCATGYFSFGHELGHLQSLRHDWFVDPTNNSPYTYNHGYVRWENNWRTVLAYNSECPAQGVGNCTRINRYSNPSVTYGGNPTGVAIGTSTSCTYLNTSNPECDADNESALENTALVFANFRTSNDGFEPDGTSGTASWLYSGVQQTHAIVPIGDDDWMKFTVPSGSGRALLETSGVTGDTRMWLYESDGTTLVEYDDDGGPGLWSYINQRCLSPGTYYVKIDDYADNSLIGEYKIDLTVFPCPPWADFDGDLDTDVSIFRPSNGRWYSSSAGLMAIHGIAGDIPVPGDYDGDGDTGIVVYRPSNGRWYFYGAGNSGFGIAGDIPMPCDYDGDGDDDIAIYRPSNGRWYVSGQGYVAYGISGDIPVPADYDGDGDCDYAIYRPSNGRWYIRGQGYWAWGIPGDIPVPGDYDGDGDFDVAIYRPSNGRWYVLGQGYLAWGIPGDIPVPGDYNGDGVWEKTIYRPSNGRWYAYGLGYTAFGIAGDYPLPARDTNIDGDPHN